MSTEIGVDREASSVRFDGISEEVLSFLIAPILIEEDKEVILLVYGHVICSQILIEISIAEDLVFRW